MPCPSLPASIWKDEHGEYGGCDASHVKIPLAPPVDRRISSELQMMAAVKILLEEIGEDVQREGILKTPLRVAKAFQSFVSGYELTPEGIIGGALFTEAGTDGGTGGGSGGMVVVRKIDSFALCDTCLLPFRLRSHVAYIPFGQRVVGLSKLPRVVNMLARRLQNPQKLANELVQALYDTFRPLGVAAAVESWHLEWPGVCDRNGGTIGGCSEDRLGFGWVPTTVYAACGTFESVQSSLWDEFLGVVELDGIEIRRPCVGTTNVLPGKDKSCPFYSHAGRAECHASISAIALGVDSLLRAEGEHVNREELQMSASRYVNWLLSATEGSNQILHNGTVIDIDLEGSLTGSGVHSNGNGCCNYPRLTSGVGGQQAGGVSLVNNHQSHGSGVVCGGTNGVANDHSTGLSYGITNGTADIYSNSISHGVISGAVSVGPSIVEHINGVHHGITNGSVIGYSNGINHGVSNGAVNGAQSFGERSKGVHCGVTGGTVNGYTNGINRGVPNGTASGYSNGAVNGTQNNGERANGSISLGMTLSADLNDHAESLSLELDLPLSSLCEHHLLPFFGVAHLGYVGGRVRLNRSLVLKIVRMFSRRLQVQERLTRQIAESVASLADFHWIMVVVEANHMCIMSRGAEKVGSTTATVATIGQSANDGALRAAFLKRISRKGPERTSP